METIERKPAEQEMPYAVANILSSYTNGFYGIDQANVALKSVGTSFRIIPGENSLSDEEKKDFDITGGPDTVTGWGLVECSDGILKKVFCQNGILQEFAVSTNSDTIAYFMVGDHIYRVRGNTLSGL